MNALVHSGSVALRADEPDPDHRAAVAANRAWELDRALMLQRSRATR